MKTIFRLPKIKSANTFASILRFLLGFVLVLLGGELGSRVHDWLKYGHSIFADVDSEMSLKVTDELGVRGKPFGRFEAASLNELGFRGPPLLEQGTLPRIIVLGASESFGASSNIREEYPNYLRANLENKEVVNASIIGMTAGTMKSYWNNRLKALAPMDVVIICNPYFYLRKEPRESLSKKQLQVALPKKPNTPTRINTNSRFLQRVKNQIKVPDFVNVIRQEWISKRRLALSEESVTDEFPIECLDNYANDVESLVKDVSTSCGGSVFLLTYPIAASSLNDLREAKSHLLNFRLIRPGFTDSSIIRFGQEANQRIRNASLPNNVILVDAGAQFGSKISMFRDLVHYNERGSRFMADLLTEVLREF